MELKSNTEPAAPGRHLTNTGLCRAPWEGPSSRPGSNLGHSIGPRCTLPARCPTPASRARGGLSQTLHPLPESRALPPTASPRTTRRAETLSSQPLLTPLLHSDLGTCLPELGALFLRSVAGESHSGTPRSVGPTVRLMFAPALSQKWLAGRPHIPTAHLPSTTPSSPSCMPGSQALCYQCFPAVPAQTPCGDRLAGTYPFSIVSRRSWWPRRTRVTLGSQAGSALGPWEQPPAHSSSSHVGCAEGPRQLVVGPAPWIRQRFLWGKLTPLPCTPLECRA